MKVATILGARPQFIKAAPLSRALRAAGMSEILVHTGQHYDESMSAVFYQELEIPAPDHHLGIGSGSHGAQTGRMLEAVERVLLDERPDWVLVYGDTNSTLAGALAAAKLHLPVAHVEAGLRSFNRRMPEEINRVLTDHVSGLLFAPTLAAVVNLRREGIAESHIRLVGDVMLDAALFFGARADEQSRVLERAGHPPQELHPGHDPPRREHRRPVPPAGDLRRAHPGRRPGPGRPPAPPADAKGPGAAEAPGPDVGTRAAHRPGWLP